MTTLLDKIFGTYLGIEFREDSIVITYLKNSMSGIILLSSSTFDMKYNEKVSDEVREYISSHGLNVNKVFVSIPDRWSITKFIDVPSMKNKGRGVLENLMKFETERHIPFEIDEVAYDFIVMDEKDNRSSVVLVAVQKQKVDLIKNYLGQLSIQPDFITISSFAQLNAIELSGVSVGGWQDIIGIVRKSDVLGKVNETNISLYIDKTHASIAIIKDGLCTHMRSIPFDPSQPLEVFSVEISQYLTEIQHSLMQGKFNKMVLSGEMSSSEELRDELDKKINIDVGNVGQLERFSGRLRGADINGLSSSIGACFSGLGIGTYNINLLPHKTDYEFRKIAPLTTKVFAVLMVILLLGIFSAEVVKQKSFLEKMEATIKKNEPAVKSLEKLLSDINGLKEQSDLLAKVEENEITLEILAELAGIMPRDSWITNLNYKGIDTNEKKKTDGELIINGYAASSSNLIPILEDSPFFEKVEFVGPIKKTRDKEQFKLSAKIVRPHSVESEKK